MLAVVTISGMGRSVCAAVARGVVPPAPSGLVATGVSPSRVDLAWLDRSRSETGFVVERSADGSSGWAQAGTTAANVTVLSDANRSAETTYYYRVKATSTYGDSAWSAVRSARTCWAPQQITTDPKDHLAMAVATRTGAGGARHVVPGMYFAYAYDGVGNRTACVDGSGEKAETTYNAMNQIATRQNPGEARLCGYADPNFSVEVHYGSEAYAAHRDGGYYYAVVPVDNSEGPVAAEMTVVVLDAAGGLVEYKTEMCLVPKAYETTMTSSGLARMGVAGGAAADGGSGDILYDNRGNLKNTSAWTYTWSGENRLLSAQMNAGAGVSESARVRVESNYDPSGRRVLKWVYGRQDGNWVLTSTTKFVWAGSQMLAETDANGVLLKSYVWKESPLGSFAGGQLGISPLLAVQVRLSGDVIAKYRPIYGENGNLKLAVDANGVVGGAYLHSPWGTPLGSDGSTDVCAFRFQGDYYEPETGLFYGPRGGYYDSKMGMLLQRDPAAEARKLNAYLDDQRQLAVTKKGNEMMLALWREMREREIQEASLMALSIALEEYHAHQEYSRTVVLAMTPEQSREHDKWKRLYALEKRERTGEISFLESYTLTGLRQLHEDYLYDKQQQADIDSAFTTWYGRFGARIFLPSVRGNFNDAVLTLGGFSPGGGYHPQAYARVYRGPRPPPRPRAVTNEPPAAAIPAWRLYEQRYGGKQTPMRTTFQGREVFVRLDKPPDGARIIDFKDYNWSNSRYQEPFIQQHVVEDFATTIAIDS